MPPSTKIGRDEIIRAATGVVREKGEKALNARNVAAALGSSTQPIFTSFGTMEKLREAVIEAAGALCGDYMKSEAAIPGMPPYKASGLGLIRFADEEKELFKLLFMRDRRAEEISDDGADLAPLIRLIMQAGGMSEERARRFHLEMWIFVHGIASMVATNYISCDMVAAGGMLTDVFQGLLKQYRED